MRKITGFKYLAKTAEIMENGGHSVTLVWNTLPTPGHSAPDFRWHSGQAAVGYLDSHAVHLKAIETPTKEAYPTLTGANLRDTIFAVGYSSGSGPLDM